MVVCLSVCVCVCVSLSVSLSRDLSLSRCFELSLIDLSPPHFAAPTNSNASLCVELAGVLRAGLCVSEATHPWAVLEAVVVAVLDDQVPWKQL